LKNYGRFAKGAGAGDVAGHVTTAQTTRETHRMSDIVETLRKVGTCIFLAAEKEVAEDIAKHVMDAADEIERLRLERETWRAAYEAAVRIGAEAQLSFQKP
jgi:hypothetical protein